MACVAPMLFPNVTKVKIQASIVRPVSDTRSSCDSPHVLKFSLVPGTFKEEHICLG